ncbi:hypothetical protein [Clostridium sp.]|uniref:hypothetical protein n=1 Tax=Clostridium sp. TaxID=1506 RepID=UPI0032174127
MLVDKFTKYMSWIMGLVITIITVLFSEYNLLFKIIIICGIIILNKYLVNATIKNINAELKKLKLQELNFLGLNPKFKIIIEIITLVTIYFMEIYFVIGVYSEGIRYGSLIGICFFIAIILISIDKLYGPKVECHKLKDETILILYESNRTGTSIFGRRVGSYVEGIIVDNFIFLKDEILYINETNEGFTIMLTGSRKIIIKDKKAEKFLRDRVK